ncbi:hypothetical protein AOXY_G12016 [Acipenser oxyrinchus oxyrinchus]|uniref:SGNH hydrolase-type esterase domain-containing protein n=1 Tax=Acipenser oxyrinchus oxyrinchus TaxID=40147 RepID=A0AAD8G7D0_ACIOX|nr:hypothetical protein AOXY_G12016 [Acipenser oxyrinchus oxyrinchus]
MVFGDSHHRSLANGFVTTPLGNLRFGFSSTPGACAAILRKEILRETLPEEPDLVVILAPGNNLTNSNTIEQAGKEFATLLHSAQHRWNKVVILDFPTRLTVDLGLQDLLRQEYHRCAARMKVRYLSISEHFPVTCSDLWCTDGVHLSDDCGMPLLAQLMLCIAFQLQETKPATTGLQSKKPGLTPRVVVRGGSAPVISSADPFQWAEVKHSTTKKAAEELFLEMTL